MSQLGRISGPLLKANLLRQGVDLAFETDLLYLDVNNLRVGIKTTSPTHDLQVVGTTRTSNLEVTNQTIVGNNLTITDNTISTTAGDITINTPSGNTVYQNKIIVDDVEIEQNIISTNATNQDLEIRTSGTGQVEIYADTLIEGNLHVTGNITADGDIQLGDADTDSVTFNADVSSNLIPNVNELYTLGSDPGTGGKRWKDLWVETIFTDAVNTGSAIIDGIDVGLNQGKIIYVATNGDDLYSGTHQNDPFASITKALSVATSGDTVFIYPGTYVETFPMPIPVGVTVRGTGIRSVLVTPTLASNNKNAFLMNGETTVEDLTVADFFYDSINDTGYAFAFASNFTVTTRSPYIRNISVLTKGSVTGPTDPLGFDQGDAGRGAKADGSLANAASREASMLFHSVTFICPAADTLVGTNGVRIEWLNSFTYYANRGMYLLSDSAGFAGDGKTKIKISSRSGTWAVGNTITYYDTDGTTVLASGVVESIDGDTFVIDGKQVGFETPSDRLGKTAVVYGNAKLDTTIKKFGTASLELDGDGDYISYASQPDFEFGTSDFTFEGWFYRQTTGVAVSLFDFRSAATQTAPWLYIGTGGGLLYVVNSTNRISTGSGTVGAGTWFHIALSRSGTNTRLFLNGTQVGSTYTDTNNYIQSPLTIGSRYTGANEFFNGYIDEIRITKDVARYTSNFTAPVAAFTSDSSTVLLLHFNGADASTVITDDGIGTQDLRTSAGGTATAIDYADYSDFGAEVRSIGSAAVYGNYGIYGDGDGVIAYLIGQNLAYIGNGKNSTNDPSTVIQANEVVELNRAKIYYSSVDHKGDFRIGDLFYVNQQTGEVDFSNSNISFTGGITFDDGLGNVTIIDSNKVQTGNIRISGNTIESLTGDVNVLSASDEINLQSNVNIVGNLDVVGNVTIGGDITIGDANTDAVNILAKIDSDLIPKVTDTYDLGTPVLRWKTVHTTQVTTDAIDINDNRIQTINSNSDLELEAAGTGRIYVPNNDVQIDQNLTVNTTTNLKNTNIVGTVNHTGTINQTGDRTQTGDLTVTGNITITEALQFEDIRIAGNVLTTTIGNNDLRLEAAGTGRIYVPNNDVEIDQTLTVTGLTTTTNINNSDTVTSATFRTSDIRINGNRIETTTSNSNLELRANGTGYIVLEQFDVQENEIRSNNNNDITLTPNGIGIVSINSTQSLKLPVGITSERPLTPQIGMVRFNSELNRYEGYSASGWIKLEGVGDQDENTYITAELTPGANDNTIRFYTNGSLVADLNSTRLNTINIDVDDINISGNTISTSTTNTNLVLQPNGLGSLVIGNFSIRSNTITNTVTDSITTFNQVGDGYFKIAGANGFVIPSGTNEQRPAVVDTGLMRFNTSDSRVEVYDGTQWVSAAGSSGGISVIDAEDLSIRNALIFG
jgi:hypothetical protein